MQPYLASHLKDMNRQTVYNLIAELGTTSKAEISKLTHISTPTTIKIVNYLVEAGLVLELGEGASAVGRKPQMLTINQEYSYSAVFFLEGEFLSFGIVDILGKVVYKKALHCTPCFDAIIERIFGGLIEGLFAEANIRLEKLLGIGIALPGIYAPHTQTILTAPLIGINQPRKIGDTIQRLQEKYGVPVMVENDTNAQCLGEFHASGADPSSDLVLLSVGTGLGAGIILGGQLRRGVNHMGGEIGYFSFLDDYVSDIRNPGWLENKISYRRLEERFGLSVDTPSSSLPPKMLELVLEYVSIPLALCINNIVMLLDCDTIRIGGVVVNLLGDSLIASINEKLSHLCISGIQVKQQSSEDIGLIGMGVSLTQNKILEILTRD